MAGVREALERVAKMPVPMLVLALGRRAGDYAPYARRSPAQPIYCFAI